jgi:hypothetical protein
MIVGVCGRIGSGKGTFADILVETHGFKKLSFADPLKDCVAAMFSWPRDLLEGDTLESREWREQESAFWTRELGYTVTPRLVLQQVGTECMRQGFFDGVWVSLAKQALENNPHTDWVIPDVRFPNEIDMIRNQGGVVIEVQRGEIPEWVDEYKTQGVEPEHIHPSEWQWLDSTIDHVIDNNGSLNDLKNQVSDLLDAISHQTSE